jgi:Tol biopolymer transport system component
MPLSIGTKLGPYEIQAPLGAGGMGEVYRARDTRLNRIVAIKILPESLAGTAESRARFEREAHAVSSLNHPHICTLYDVGHQDGIDFLVMEYLEGESLAKRLERGPLALPELLRIGIEIADALEKSHRQGVVHRDLKPGNIMLTKAGAKLLDFGLAKTAAPLGWDLSSSPTASQPLGTPASGKALTAEGSIVGTFQYMSPEQLEGKEADSRSDIFSFGAVLYEMATGKKAFEAKSQASLIAAILEHEPAPVRELRPTAPAALERAVQTCLAKNPDERFQSAHDLKLQLEWIRDADSQAGAPAVPIPPRAARRGWIAAVAAAAVVALIAAGVTWQFAARPGPQPAITRFVIPTPENANFELALAISPNGRLLAFVASSAGKSLLWIRALDSLEAHPLNGTDGANLPFWSPESSSIGFFAGGKLKRIDLASGVIQTVCDVPDSRGGSWGRDGTILFSPDSSSPIYRVSGETGTPTPVTAIDPSKNETSHRWPDFLPDGRHFLYFARTGGKATESVYLASLDSPERKRILDSDSNVRYAPPGYLLFVRGRTLFARPFDTAHFELHGGAAAIAEGVEPEGEVGPSSYARFSVSENGVLVYRTGAGDLNALTWFDRHGKHLGTVGPPAYYDQLALSPDTRRIAMERSDQTTFTNNIYLLDVSSGAFTRFTFGTATELGAVWSPDGSHIAFGSNRSGGYEIYWKPSDGSAGEEPLVQSSGVQTPDGWSPDGRYLVYDKVGPGSDYDLWILPMFGDRKPYAFLQAPGIQQHAAMSPGGHWIAYESDESGRFEIYVQSFPTPGGKWQVTSEGGLQPQWRRDGRELFYLAPNRKLMAVATQESPTFSAGVPQALFDAPISLNGINDSRARYVFMPDGQRVLVVATHPESAAASAIRVVLNWPAGLQKK